MKTILKTLLVTALLSTLTYAEDIYKDDMKFTLGAFALIKTDNSLSVSTDIGSIGYSPNFNGDTVVFRSDNYYRFNDAHRVELSLFNISKTDDDGSYNNQFTTLLDYGYSFYKNEKVELTLLVGLHMTSYDLGVSTDTGDKSKINTTAPLPVIGFAWRYNIMPQWSVGSKVQYFAMSLDFDSADSIITGFQGYVADTMVDTEYMFTPNFGAGLALNSIKSDLGISTGKIDWKVKNEVLGVNMYLSMHF